MRTTLLTHALASAGASAAILLIAGGIASAHLDPDPIAMQAGSTATVEFNIEHGCNGSPTNDLKIQIPTGVTGVAAVDKAGWTSSVTGDTVEWKGGSLAADKVDHFDITLTAPAAVGDIHFPAIQTCVAGELDWIEIAAQGAPEPESPAPTIKITQGPPTSAELTPVPDAPKTTAVSGGTVAPLTTSVTLAAPAKSSSNTGAIVAVVIGVAVVAVGGGVLLVRRKKATPPAAPKG